MVGEMRTLSGSVLSSLRQSSSLCDVRLCVDSAQFPAHKVVLAASSPYFHAMFTGGFQERDSATVTLKGIDASILDKILHHIYSGGDPLDVTLDNYQLFMEAADLLDLQTVMECCSQFLEEELDIENCVDIRIIAAKHNHPIVLT